ncbi:MAG: hypothetical protein QOJ67_3836 [Acidimicrobiaceae bacterium]
MTLSVLYAIDSLDPGGAERSLVALVPHLAARGVLLTVVVLEDRPGLHAEARAAGAEVLSVAGSGGRAGRVRRLRDLMVTRRPKLVHTTLFEADICGRVAATLARVPVVCSLVNVNYTPQQQVRDGVRRSRLVAARTADAATAQLVRRFHANAAHVADVMTERLHIRGDRVEVIPRGRDRNVLGDRTVVRRAAARAALGALPDTPLVLAVARHEHQKGLDVLVDAFARLVARGQLAPRLLVAGRTGTATAALERRVADSSLADRVTLLGPRDDVADLLSAADVFVLPSRWEGFPGAVVEAMALEAPIVASDLPGVREALGPRLPAVLVPPESAMALASALDTVLDDPRSAANRAAEGRSRFLSHFTIEEVAAQMAGFYERALTSAGRP